jgi:hypothetical protein
MFLSKFPGKQYALAPVELIAELGSADLGLVDSSSTPQTLSYRGSSYSVSSTGTPPITSGLKGMYRGIRYKLSQTSPAPHNSLTLTYRGSRYSN